MKHLVALILFFPSVCFAYTYEEAKNIISQYTQFEINSLDCAQYASYDGMYFFGANRLVICEDNIRTNRTAREFDKKKFQTLLHEAVHLAQDCASGVENDIIEPIQHDRPLNPNVKDIIKKRYKPEFVEVEIEAWSYKASIEAIDLVKKYCA